MKAVLFVSIAFPPKNDPECLQTSKYYKYLTAHADLEFSVVTSAIPTLFMPFDEQLKEYDKNYVQKIELPVYESKLINFLLRKFLPNGIDFPDSKFMFHWQKTKVVKSLKQKPDVIYSRSNPLSSSLLAYKLRQHYGVPWVMHMSDPWVDSPVHSWNSHQIKYHEGWEKKCFTAADFITFTSKHAIDFYSSKYGNYASKFLYFPNVYDPQDVFPDDWSWGEKLTIVYTGGLTKERSPEFFLSACRKLLERYPGYENKFQVFFAGPFDKYIKRLFLNSDLPNVIHIGLLPYREAILKLKTAHVLLTIDLPIKDPRKAMFFPSKILDYFLVRRKILALTTEQSTTEAVLKNLNCKVLTHHDIEELVEFIKSAVMAHEQKNKTFFTLEGPPEEYSAKMNANRLAELLRKL